MPDDFGVIGSASMVVSVDMAKLEKDLKEARKALNQVGRDMEALQKDFKSGAFGLETYNARMEDLAKRAATLRSSVGQVTEAIVQQQSAVLRLAPATSVLDTSMAKVANTASGKTARGLLQLSYAVDDVRFEFANVLNNVPGIIMGFGGTAGIAGAVAIAAIGITELVTHWDDITGLWSSGETETEAERMDRLANATKRTAAETKELHDWEAKRAELEKIRSTPDEFQSMRAGDFNKVLGQVGGKETESALTAGANAYNSRQFAKMSPEAIKKYVEDVMARAAKGEAWAAHAMDALLSEPGARDSKLAKARDDLGKSRLANPDAARKEDEEKAVAKIQAEGKGRAERVMESAGAAFLGGKRDVPQLAAEIKDQLKKAGVNEAYSDDAIREAARQVQAQIGSRVDNEALKQGVGRDEAEKSVLEDLARKRDGEALKGVKDAANRFTRPFAAQGSRAMAAGRAAGQPIAETDRALQAGFEQALTKQGSIPPELVSKVAAQIVANIRKNFDDAVMEDLANGGGDAVSKLTKVPGQPGVKAPGGRRPAMPIPPPEAFGPPPAAEARGENRPFRMVPGPRPNPAADARRDAAVAGADAFARQVAERNAAIREQAAGKAAADPEMKQILGKIAEATDATAKELKKKPAKTVAVFGARRR